MSDTLLRHWQLLKEIPRAPQKADVKMLLAKLKQLGHSTTPRTLQRDLNMLSTVFPIQSDTKSIPFGWSWMKDKSLEVPNMDGRAALMLKMVEQFIPTLMPPEMKEYLQPYFSRANTVLKQNSQEGKRRWLDCVRVVPREMPLLPPKVDAAATQVVYQAVLEGKRFTADYWTRDSKDNATATYEVNPLGIVVRGNLVYLACTLWKYTDVKQFAMHRFKNAALIDKPAKRPPGFDLDKYIGEGEFQYPVGPMIKLKAIFDRSAAAHLYETPLSEDQTIEDIDDIRVLVTASINNTKQLEWWLLGLGSMIEILEPKGLRSRIRANLSATAEIYGVASANRESVS